MFKCSNKHRNVKTSRGRSSNKDLINYIDKNMILNCPVRREEKIFRPNPKSLNRNMRCTAKEHIAINTYNIT